MPYFPHRENVSVNRELTSKSSFPEFSSPLEGNLHEIPRTPGKSPDFSGNSLSPFEKGREAKAFVAGYFPQ
jgi:hypothetical protein